MAGNQQLTPRINRLEPNVLIDGAMEIWPEGTSRAVANNNSLYGSVLMKCNNTSSAITLTNSRVTGPDNVLQFANQVSKTAAGTLAAGTATNLEYGVEGYDLERIMQDEFTVLFKVKSSVASLRSCSIRNSTGSHSYIKQYQINQANTWEVKALRFDALSTCPGTINRTNVLGMLLNFSIVNGTNTQSATLNQWITPALLGGVGEDTTWLTGTTHDFNIAGVMILPGDFSAIQSNPSFYKFVRAGRTFAHEVAISQRYYEKSYDLEIASGTPAAGGGQYAHKAPSLNAFFTVTMKNFKRVAPTVLIYNPTTGTLGQIRDTTAGTDRAATSFAIGQSAFSIQCVTQPAGNEIGVQWATDARF